MNPSYAEDLEWSRLRVLVATQRAASAEQGRRRDAPSARRVHEARTELHRATICLRAHLAEAFHAHANPLFWHDRFGRPRALAEAEPVLQRSA